MAHPRDARARSAVAGKRTWRSPACRVLTLEENRFHHAAPMDLSGLIEQYGYLAVFVGTLLEGETILALGGFAAHSGHLDLRWVIAVAFCGSVLGDQTAFLVGHFWGKPLLGRSARLTRTVERARPHLVRHADLFVLVNRFLIGLRTAGPIAVGIVGMPWPRFLVLNMIGAAAWSATIAVAGYLLGQGLETLLGDLKHVEKWILAGLALAAAAFWVVRRIRAGQAGSA
jgi:membrane protein DedA with SNARE-associated domain